MEVNLMFALSAADAPRRSLFAFHFELSRMPRRKPSSLVLRGAHGLMARFTMPRGSNKKGGLFSWGIALHQSLHMPSSHCSLDIIEGPVIGRSTGVLICPHPGIKAEKRPACPPTTNR